MITINETRCGNRNSIRLELETIRSFVVMGAENMLLRDGHESLLAYTQGGHK